MTRVRGADRRYARGMARRGEPVADRGPDRPATDWRVATRRMTGDEQQDALPVRDRLFQPAIETAIGAGETVAVQIDNAIGGDDATRQPAIPAAIQPS